MQPSKRPCFGLNSSANGRPSAQEIVDFRKRIIDLGPALPLDGLTEKQLKLVAWMRKSERYWQKWGDKNKPAPRKFSTYDDNDDILQPDEAASIDGNQQYEKNTSQRRCSSDRAPPKEPEPSRGIASAEDGNDSTHGSKKGGKELSKTELEYRKTLARVFDPHRGVDLLLDTSEYVLLKLIEETLVLHFNGRDSLTHESVERGTMENPAVVRCRNLLELATTARYSTELIDILTTQQMPHHQGVYTPSCTIASTLLTSARLGLPALIQLCEAFNLGVDQTHNRIRTIMNSEAHCFALDVDLITRRVTVCDSGNTGEDSEHYTRTLRDIVDALCRDRSWEAQDNTGEWEVSWNSNVYHQMNSFDCGAHAVDNFLNLIYGVPCRSDSPIGIHLRHIHLVRIRAILDRTMLSGARLLGASSTLPHKRCRSPGI